MNILYSLFCIRPSERRLALVALLVALVLNGLFIGRLHELFLQEGIGIYWKTFEHEFHLSGYDPYTYSAVTDWDYVYQVHRHPLLAWMVYPLFLLNSLFSSLTGVNCVQYIVQAVIMICSVYSCLFMYRISLGVVGLGAADATLVSVLFYSLAYVMLSIIVPDHFTPSMLLLLLTLYVAGRSMALGRYLSWWQGAVLLLVIGGITLSNGVKVLLAEFFVDSRRFFRPHHLLLAVALPVALLWGVASWQYRSYVLPKEQARQEQQERLTEQKRRQVAAMTPAQRQEYEKRYARRQQVLRRQAAKTGKPLEDHGFLKWTDISTPRLHTLYENFFGESLIFHRRHFLEDTLVGRPVFVSYEGWLPYFAEALLLVLVLGGIWAGRHSRFMWLCLSVLGFNLLLHIVLGFGINEVFIMAPHWAFVLPVAVAFLLRGIPVRWRWCVRCVVGALAASLWVYNARLLVSFLLTPIQPL